MKQPFGRGCPVLYHSILLYFSLSLATVAKCILLELAPIMPAFCSLLLPSYFSKNYAGKIAASLLITSSSSAAPLLLQHQPLPDPHLLDNINPTVLVYINL